MASSREPTLGAAVSNERVEKHEGLRRALLGEVMSGRFHPGDLFYSQKEIEGRFGVSQTTVLRALKALADEGHIERIKGRGTFVTRPRSANRQLQSFLVIGHELDLSRGATVNVALDLLLTQAAGDGVEAEYMRIPYDLEKSTSLPNVSRFDAVVTLISGFGIPWRLAEQNDAPVIVVRPLDLALAADFDCINRDYVGGAQQVLAHFRDCGYRRIGMMAGSPGNLYHHLRMEGTMTAACAFGMTVKPEWVVPAGFKPDRAYEGARALLSREDRPRAIFAFGDEMAAATLRAAHELGLSVPDDLAVAGFDGLSFSAHLTPPLTCYHTSPEAFAQTLYDLLAFRVADPDAPLRNEIVKGEVVIRQSTRLEGAADSRTIASRRA